MTFSGGWEHSVILLRLWQQIQLHTLSLAENHKASPVPAPYYPSPCGDGGNALG